MARHERQRAAEVRARRDSGIQVRKAKREAERMHALTGRITTLLSKLKTSGEIADFRPVGRPPDTAGTSTIIHVRRADGMDRWFVCTFDFRLARLISEAPEKEGAPKVSAIIVTHEMRDQSIAERVLALFQN